MPIMPEAMITTKSAKETIRFGRQLSRRLRRGDIVYLTGELGSGKTVIAKGICQGFGVKDTVTSPSFVIATEYQGKFPISHIDLYRLGTDEVVNESIHEYIKQDGITIVEWADHMASQAGGIHIHIIIKDKRIREISLEDLRN